MTMPNEINDPSFELGLTGAGNWESGARSSRGTTVTAFDGVWVHNVEKDQTPGAADGRFGQRVTLPFFTEELEWHLSWWMRVTAAGLADIEGVYALIQVFLLHVIPSGGGNLPLTDLNVRVNLVDLSGYVSFPAAPPNTLVPPGPWRQFSIDFIPRSREITILCASVYDGTTPGFDARYDSTTEYDSFALAQPNAFRVRIREALVARLKTIAVANGYSIDIGDVFDEKKSRRDVRAFPAIMVGFGVEEKEQTAMHTKGSVLKFPLLLSCEGPTADEQCDDVAADIEKVLETLVQPFSFIRGTFLSLSFIDDLTVTTVDRMEEKGAMALGVMQAMIEVQVVYRHPRAQA